MLSRAILFVALCACAASVVSAQPPPPGPVVNLPLLPSNVSLSSKAGYFTVDESTGSNLFFWLFDALHADPTTAPLLIWMNGGPGSSSMYGLFTENGPFFCNDANCDSLQMRDIAWTNTYNVMFIDNPVGTGFSYTESTSGFATNQVEVGANLYSLLYQFYQMYPQYQALPLYICAESYGGKYAPAFAYTVHMANQAFRSSITASPASIKSHHAKHAKTTYRLPGSAAPHNVPNGFEIPLTGISIGDGMMDPITQVPGYGALLRGLSVIDADEEAYFQEQEQMIVDLISQEQYLEAFRLFDPLMMDDEARYGSYFFNVTGLQDYYNFKQPVYAPNPFDTIYLNREDVKAALNVPTNYQYSSGNNTVEIYLLSDWMKSVKPWITVLLENYPVLIYNGQNDIILASQQCLQFLNTIEWTGADEWAQAERQIWYQHEGDYAPAGYVRQGGNLTYVQVRDAGHLLPQDQPGRAFDMITRFVEGIPF